MKVVNCVFDGACEPTNPGGAMGMGGAIFEDRKLLSKYSSFEPINIKNTNNVAEYKAVLWVMDELIKLSLHNERITIFGDSKLVINQLKGEWKINKGEYSVYALIAKQKKSLFKSINFIWIPREENAYADNLSKKALKEHNIEITIR